METLIASQLQHFAEVGRATFIGWYLIGLAIFFAFLALLLGKQAFAMHRNLSLLLRSFSEPAIQSSRFFSQAWQEYSHTFFNDLHGNYKTTRAAAIYFNPEEQVAEALGLRWWRFTPAVLFACGMLMLLIQLVYGLIGFDLSTTDVVMESLEHAFMSVANGLIALGAAMLCSLAMFFLLRFTMSVLLREVRSLAAMLDRRYLISTLEEREITLAEYAKTLTRIVTTLFSEGKGTRSLTPGALSKQLLEQMARTNTLLEQLATTQGGEASGKAMAEALRPELQRMVRSLQEGAGYNAAPADLTAALQNAAQTLQRSLNALQSDQEARLLKSQGPKQ